MPSCLCPVSSWAGAPDTCTEGLVDTVVTGPGKVYLQTMSLPRLAGLLAPYLVTDKK